MQRGERGTALGLWAAAVGLGWALGSLETHAVQKGLALQDLAGFHRALVEAVQGGFAQVFGLAALLAGIGVMAGFLVPRRLGGRPDES
jgi:hypothetical protein